MRLVQKYQKSGQVNVPPKTWEETLKRPTRVQSVTDVEHSSNSDWFNEHSLLTTQYGDSTIHNSYNDITNGNVNFSDWYYTNALPTQKASEENIPVQSDGRHRVISINDKYGVREIYPGDPLWNDYYNRLKTRTDQLWQPSN